MEGDMGVGVGESGVERVSDTRGESKPPGSVALLPETLDPDRKEKSLKSTSSQRV